MYIATVIPISKSVQKEQLTYFTAKEIPLGSVVMVPVRSRTVEAIVINLEEAKDLKSAVKDAAYQLKKIESVKGIAPYRKSFFEACELMKNYSISTTGAVIDALLPQILIEKYADIKKVPYIEPEISRKDIKHEKLIFQALTKDRMSWYRTLIRESFAKKESVYICVPTEYDIDKFYTNFAKGIEQYVYKFHSHMKKLKLVEDYNSAVTEEHPILIIGTGMYLSIPRYDIRTIIVEHESSESYKQIGRPYIDIRSFAEVLADCEKIKLIYGDTLLRPETLHRHDIGELGEVASPLFRLPQVERQIIVDMKDEVDDKGQHSFTVLSDTTKKMVTYALEHNESVFLFSVRKGLAGITVCHDCGHTLLCEHCHTPVVLYGSKQKTADKEATDRIFMCNKCGHKGSTQVRCPDCDSWNLTPLGIGTDRVVEELSREFPDATIVQIDKETTSNDGEMQKACNMFYGTKGAILVGTEMAFSCMKEEVTHSAIVSLDGLLSIPSYNINQKILHLIEKLSSVTIRNMIIQTRIPDNIVLKHVLVGNVLPLYRSDLKEREDFGYPPYKRLIKITFTGTARENEKARDYLEKIFAQYEPQIFSAFVSRVRGQYITNTVIKLDKTIWPFPPKENLLKDNTNYHDLYSKLASLPPQFSINVDPEDLL